MTERVSVENPKQYYKVVLPHKNSIINQYDTCPLFFFVLVFFLEAIIAYKDKCFFMQRGMSCIGIHPPKTIFPFRTVMPILYTCYSVPLLPHTEMHILA